jgi:hypothetical protein
MPSSTSKPSQSIILRRLTAVVLMILLFISAQPFTPFRWVFRDNTSLILDSTFSVTLLLAGLGFQWQIAGCRFPVACIIPLSSLGLDDSTIRSGNLGRSNRNDLVWIYNPSDYWKYAGFEAVLLCIAEWFGYELLRRGIIFGVLGALWGVGWFVTPQHVKTKAWDMIKWMWIRLAVNQVMQMGSGRGRRRW